MTPSDEQVLAALAELRGLTECYCSTEWTKYSRHAPECNADFRDEVEVVTAALRQLPRDAD